MFDWRPHRGWLADAMAEKRSFQTFDEMVAFLQTDWGAYGVTVSEIEVKPYGFDDRIGWDTYIVTGLLSNGERSVLGFTNGPALAGHAEMCARVLAAEEERA